MPEQIPYFKTHICYVSAESMPNLLLCLDPALKPEKVYLLTSREMTDNGKYDVLAQNFRNFGVDVKLVQVMDVSYNALTEFIANFVAELIGVDSNIAFNVTCGTKLMTLAAFKACQDLVPMFYVDTYNKKLFFLEEKQEYELSNLCSVKNILTSYGYSMREKDRKHIDNNQVFQLFLNQDDNVIGALNALSAKALKEGFAVGLDAKRTSPKLMDFLKKCHEAGLLRCENETVMFKDEDACKFCNGAWLEEYVLHNLKQLKAEKQIDDCEGAVGVDYAEKKTSGVDDYPDNELDALFVRNNILYLVECKTCKMDDNEKSRNYMYKLSFLHNKTGGVFSRGILVSFIPLKEQEKTHAQKSNLIVIDGKQNLKNLRKMLIDAFENEKRRK